VITNIAKNRQKLKDERFKEETFCFRLCLLGRRLLKDIDVLSDCNKNVNGVLHNIYCNGTKCDSYYSENNLTIANGIRGLASGVFLGEEIVIKLYH